MRYYCPRCKSEYLVGEKLTAGYCTMLEDTGEECGEILIKLPDFETPAQYENRTGKKLSTKAAVWIKCKNKEGFINVRYDNEARQNKYFYWNKYLDIEYILVVNSPEPLPDSWRPS